jgi:TolB-like protein/Flp pilus assembly protein TadD
MTGRILGHYRILTKLGEGGMGEVYRATDTTLGRDVALKVLPADMASSPERLERFRREAKALAALDHPGIVTVYSVEEADGVHFLTMQLVEGQPLDRLIPGTGLPIERVVTIGAALAEALATAHERGIVHRDLKPANVVVGEGDSVKVLDFGLAKMSQASGPSESALPTEAQTRDGVVMGTVPYMSPEQVSGRPVDHRTDVFSLGIVLYEMASGRRPFQGGSTAELASAILRDVPPAVIEHRRDVPPELSRLIRRCLEKDPRWRVQTARDVGNELRELRRSPVSDARSTPAADSGAARREEGFWIAVLPFKHRGADPGVEALADGLTEDIVTGLSRFSYLRVIARSSTLHHSGESLDVRSIGHELGARYVMEGSVRQAGSTLRVAAQLVDAASGAHLWAESYNRPFRPDEIFELQDDVAPRIVSTVADMNGILPHTMSEALRGRDSTQLSPYEAVLRGFGYFERITAEEHAEVRSALGRAVEEAPDHADCWALLSMMYAEEHKHGFNVQPDPLGRALETARRAVAIAPSNNLAYHMLAQALFFRRELQAFRNAADRAVALNPMDGCTTAFMGILMAYAGDWDHGCALAEKAMQLNPHHPGWYRFSAFYNAYRKGDYRAALDVALKINMPSYYYTHVALAQAHGQLGDREAAQRALRELLAQKPHFAEAVHEELGKWLGPGELLEHALDGLRKAGLDIPEPGAVGEGVTVVEPMATSPATAAVRVAVLPFADMSAAKDQDYLCEGMAEEIMNALVRIQGIRVASRTSAFRAGHENRNLAEISRALSVSHVLEGSVRVAGSRLRVTAQLTDVESGYQLWSERYDREAVDVFALQDDIAVGVVEAVKARLAPGERIVRARPQIGNLEAYRYYLKGGHLRYTKNDHGGALKAFEEAVRLDPSHAPSWVGLAEVCVQAAVYNLLPAREAYVTAKDALARAAAQQGVSAEALCVEGMIAFGERDWRGAERVLRRGVELQPDYVQGGCWLGMLQTLLGESRAAALALERAREADPLAPYPYAMTGISLLLAGRAAEAGTFLDQALAFETGNTLALWVAGTARIALGRFDEGVALVERATTPSHRGGFIHGVLGWALAAAGRTDEARGVLDELRARPAPAPAVVSEAWLLAALGEMDGAFLVLDQAEAECQPVLGLIGLPGSDRLRNDPRFGALLARMGLPASRRD